MTEREIDLIRDAVIRSVWKWQDGWRFCDEKFDDQVLKMDDDFRALVYEKFGNPPFGQLVYSDDCACQIDGAEGMHGPSTCGCACHRTSRQFADIVIAELKGQDYPASSAKEERQDKPTV